MQDHNQAFDVNDVNTVDVFFDDGSDEIMYIDESVVSFSPEQFQEITAILRNARKEILKILDS